MTSAQIRGIMHLTYLNSDGHKGAVSTPSAGTGAPEIKITPEMIVAGVAALNFWLDRWGQFEGWPGDRYEVELVSSILSEAISISPTLIKKSLKPL
jgi:hypothetical protein